MARREALNPTSDALARNNGSGPAIDGVRTEFGWSYGLPAAVRTRPVAAKGHFALDASARLTGINR